MARRKYKGYLHKRKFGAKPNARLALATQTLCNQARCVATCSATVEPERNLTVPTTAAPENNPHLPLCGNCETSLQGPFCHMCGQAVRSPVREFFSFVFDSAGEFMRPDGKFFRSLAALYFRPGMLTKRYLEGQRVNFIKPVKLYFSLSVILFLLVGFEMNFKSELRPTVRANGNDVIIGFDDAKPDPKPAEKLPAKGAPIAAQPEASLASVSASVSAVKPDVDKIDKFVEFDVKGKPWDATTNPFVISWLPAFANSWLNGKLAHLNEVGDEAQKHPEKVVDSLFHVLPTMMFLLLPVFALVLKGLYFFRKRLYAEHLLVAVQSHSFLFLSFIVLVLLTDIAELSGPNMAKFTTPIAVIVGLWMPIYLFLMQKRVYRQGWFWTSFKYGVGGFTYSMLLSIGLSFAIVAALVNM